MDDLTLTLILVKPHIEIDPFPFVVSIVHQNRIIHTQHIIGRFTEKILGSHPLTDGFGEAGKRFSWQNRFPVAHDRHINGRANQE